jgi:glycerol-3-phosphate cytidylyltransferase-like family protein
MIRGTVLVDRLKLIKEGDQRKIVITFDRRVKEEVVVEALEKLGYEVEVKRIELL